MQTAPNSLGDVAIATDNDVDSHSILADEVYSLAEFESVKKGLVPVGVEEQIEVGHTITRNSLISQLQNFVHLKRHRYLERPIRLLPKADSEVSPEHGSRHRSRNVAERAQVSREQVAYALQRMPQRKINVLQLVSYVETTRQNLPISSAVLLCFCQDIEEAERKIPSLRTQHCKLLRGL